MLEEPYLTKQNLISFKAGLQVLFSGGTCGATSTHRNPNPSKHSQPQQKINGKLIRYSLSLKLQP